MAHLAAHHRRILVTARALFPPVSTDTEGGCKQEHLSSAMGRCRFTASGAGRLLSPQLDRMCREGSSSKMRHQNRRLLEKVSVEMYAPHCWYSSPDCNTENTFLQSSRRPHVRHTLTTTAFLDVHRGLDSLSKFRHYSHRRSMFLTGIRTSLHYCWYFKVANLTLERPIS